MVRLSSGVEGYILPALPGYGAAEQWLVSALGAGRKLDHGIVCWSWKRASFNARAANGCSGNASPASCPCQRASEAFQKMIFQEYLDGINRSRLGRREGIGAATVERYFQHGLGPAWCNWYSSGKLLSAWSQEIVAMWGFTRNNGITEGFHNKWS